MLFHTLPFIYLFLPITLFFYFIARNSLRNPILLAASLIFSAWFSVYLTGVLLFSIALNYFAGIAIENANRDQKKRRLFILAVVANLLVLVLFKYLVFLVNNLSDLCSLLGITPFVMKEFILPLGLSFYTFKALSYLISVKRKEVPAQRNFTELAVYISLFPQLAAGPIDRYTNLAPQLSSPSPSFERFSSGIARFVLGLAKMVIISTPLSIMADKIFSSPVSELNAALAWLGAIGYMLQIYYDFSGYTDMAIGIGKMLGLEFAENFKLPYSARSVKDFWNRWHITLSTWFRDYLFLPLAYSRSRKMKKQEYLGVRTDHWVYFYAAIITFLLCGLWHGSAWTFLLWGLFHGVMLVAEQFGLRKILRKAFPPLQHLYLLLFLVFSWVLFRSPSLQDALQYMGAMFGSTGKGDYINSLYGYLNVQTVLVLIIGILGAAGFFDRTHALIQSLRSSETGIVRFTTTHLFYLSAIAFLLAIMSLATIFIIAGTSTPFIYFKF